jgi:NAD-dependent DNA ligase
MADATTVQFTVGKIDAGLAVLLSPENYVVEFPSAILPEKVRVGSIVNVTVEQNLVAEERQMEEFDILQNEIYEEFSQTPEVPEVSAKRITQTSVLLEWTPLVLKSATLRSIDVMRDGLKLSTKIAENQTKVKVTSLEVQTKYELQIILRTSAGSFPSNKLVVETHSMENLTGLYPCFGTFSNESDIDVLTELLQRVGASYSDELSSENSHLVCSLPKGPKYDRAVELNIPIVTPEFLKSCESAGKVLPAHTFYITKSSF